MKPPSSDRGAQISVGVDWLAFSIWGRSVEQVEEEIRSYTVGEFVELDRGGLGYRRQRVGPGEARILYEGRTPEIHVILTGEFCRSVEVSEMRRLLRYVRSSGRASRVDVAGDDYTRGVVPADVREAVKRGALVTHARERGFVESLTGNGGATLHVGRRGSRQFLRVYDKGAESHGEKDCIRWELEFRDEMAVTVVDELAELPWGDVWACRLLTYVDFRARWDDMNVSRCPRLPWFQALIDAAERWRAYSPEPVGSIDAVAEWIERQVWPSLALLVAADGGEMQRLYEGLKRGRERWSSNHRALLAAAAA